ncbi:MAG: dipeptidase [Pseudomonadales bacterium]|nr:dipeptidase [Pseudomonadales bacterium]MCP5215536.1 dipeptidase [Pseudomonadales bacterium]
MVFKVRKRLFKLFLVMLLASTTVPYAQAQITKEQSQRILKQYEQKTVTGFRPFLSSVAQQHATLANTIHRYLAEQRLNQKEQNDIYRLLGIYTTQRYGREAIAMLKYLVAFDTSIVESVPQHENPQMVALGKELEKIANEFGLAYLNVDNHVFEITLAGDTPDLIGFHAHADVVPVNRDLWVLADNTRLDPFKVTTIGNRMYGRGTQDDKCGIVVSLFAMRVIKEESLPLRQTLRLIIDTTEETSGTAIPYYMERRPMPLYNLALDGSYPVVIAEKGYGTVMASFPLREVKGEALRIVGLSGGLATNQIPQAATAHFAGNGLNRLKRNIDQASEAYVQQRGANFSMQSELKDDLLVLKVTGVSAHSSQPESGVNPVSRLLEFIADNYQAFEIVPNHFTDAAIYGTQNWGVDFYGKQVGIDFVNDFMGPLTAAQTYIGLDRDSLKTAVNIRLPRGKTSDELKQELALKLELWQQRSLMDIKIEHSQAEPMYRNPEGAWVKNLLAIAAENLNIEPEFGSSNGATSAHNLPNGVQFGLALATEKYTGHNANEFKTIDQFFLDLQIVTEAFIRVGNLASMQ